MRAAPCALMTLLPAAEVARMRKPPPLLAVDKIAEMAEADSAAGSIEVSAIDANRQQAVATESDSNGQQTVGAPFAMHCLSYRPDYENAKKPTKIYENP